jgi:hypothetical protein
MTVSRLLPRTWELPPALADRLGDEVGRQRCMISSGHLLLVLHDLPKPGDAARAGRLFWRRPDGTWDSSTGGAGIQGLVRHLDAFAKAIDALEERLAAAAAAADIHTVVQAAAPLARTARNLHRTLQEARDGIPGDRELILARDRAYELERAAELLHHDAGAALQFAAARQAEEQTRAALGLAQAGHRLNLVAALALPLMAVASVFGMNLPSGFEGLGVIGFWAIVAAAVALGAALYATGTGGQQPRR